MAHVNRKEYWVIFVVLTVLTLLEVGIVYTSLSWGVMVSALIGLAVTKAAIVGLFYMHLKHETKILRLTVAIPMGAPAFYAVVLIVDAQWRGLFWML